MPEMTTPAHMHHTCTPHKDTTHTPCSLIPTPCVPLHPVPPVYCSSISAWVPTSCTLATCRWSWLPCMVAHMGAALPPRRRRCSPSSSSATSWRRNNLQQVGVQEGLATGCTHVPIGVSCLAEWVLLLPPRPLPDRDPHSNLSPTSPLPHVSGTPLHPLYPFSSIDAAIGKLVDLVRLKGQPPAVLFSQLDSDGSGSVGALVCSAALTTVARFC